MTETGLHCPEPGRGLEIVAHLAGHQMKHLPNRLTAIGWFMQAIPLSRSFNPATGNRSKQTDRTIIHEHLPRELFILTDHGRADA